MNERVYDPDSELSRPPEIGEKIWVLNHSKTRLTPARIDKIIPIPEMLSHCDARGRSWGQETWMRPGYLIMAWVAADQRYLETRFREADRR